MVYLKKISFDGVIAVYDYMPEHKDAPSGRVSVNSKNGARELVKRSEEDTRTVYAIHAWNRIDQMLEEHNLREETYCAWY